MRGRKAEAIKALEQYDFDKLSKTQGNPREGKRYLTFAHIRDGKIFTETASAIRIKLRTLINWLKRFKALVIHGLRDRAPTSAKPCISPEDRAVFKGSVLELQQKRSAGRIRGSRCVGINEGEIQLRDYFQQCI